MAGRNTTLHPDDFPSCGMVKPFELSDTSIASLNYALGRNLAHEEITSLNNGIARYRQMRVVYHGAFPTNQDLKRTLEYVSNLAPAEAQAAYIKCDEITRTLIEESLWRSNRISYPYPPELIPDAARLALTMLQAELNKGGVRTKGYQALFADYCLKSWARCGGTSMALGYDNHCCTPSPLLSWSTTLFSALEQGINFDWRKTIRLLKQAKR